MPKKPPRICSHPGCNTRTTKGKCDKHRRKHGWQSDKVRGNRHDRGYGSEWDKTRPRILQRDGYLCQPCKRKGIITAASEVDHIVPKERGGTDDDGNLQSICDSCHEAKTIAERQQNR